MVKTRNLTSRTIPQNALRKLAELVLRKEQKGGRDLSVVFVELRAMRKLNRAWRGKDRATNVLAFQGGELSLGEIVLCPSVISKDAVEYKIPLRKALAWMFVHGLLHLLGYGHKTAKEEGVMRQKEQRYLCGI